MPSAYQHLLDQLELLLRDLTPDKESDLLILLRQLTNKPGKRTQDWARLQDHLLFLLTYPMSPAVYKAALQLGRHMTQTLRTDKTLCRHYKDSGLPFTSIYTRYAPEIWRYLLDDRQCRLYIDEFEAGSMELGTWLSLTLPGLEWDETQAGYSNEDLWKVLGVKPAETLRFLVDQAERYERHYRMKVWLWEQLKVWVCMEGIHPSFSRLWNRLTCTDIFYSSGRWKPENPQQIPEWAIPAPDVLNTRERDDLIRVIRRSFMLTFRETDPATFMEPRSLRIYTVERGTRIALYTAAGVQQLPWQSYVGYTLFRNGYPVAYGGSWVFGRQAMFGLNVFEAFRGGESVWIMSQLLRVYRQVFNLSSIAVEPYQYGAGNPDGIRSGAFWFYYRFGFRPVRRDLLKLAASEQAKIRSSKNYRSSAKTLLAFTEAPIRLMWDRHTSPDMQTLQVRIRQYVQKHHKGMRTLAEQHAVQRLREKISALGEDVVGPENLLAEFGLLCEAYQLNRAEDLALIQQCIHYKPFDPYTYNQVLMQLLSRLN